MARRPTQDIGRWDRPARIVLGAILVIVSVAKIVTAPGNYPASDPRSSSGNWVLFAVFVGGMGLLSIATGIFEPLRRASLGTADGAASWSKSRTAMAVSGFFGTAGMVALGLAFDLPFLVLIGAASLVLTIASLSRRKE